MSPSGRTNSGGKKPSGQRKPGRKAQQDANYGNVAFLVAGALLAGFAALRIFKVTTGPET